MGGKMKMGGKMDPGAIFDRMSRGQDFVSIESMWWLPKDQAAEWTSKEGIKNGKLNREQFMKLSEYLQEQMRSKFGGPKGGAPGGAPGDTKGARDGKGDGKGGPEGKGGGKGGPEGKGGKGFPDPEDIFKRYDLNGDGFLNEDEISQTRGGFKDDWKKWDKNKDS